MKVEVAVLGFSSLIVRPVSVDVKQHGTRTFLWARSFWEPVWPSGKEASEQTRSVPFPVFGLSFVSLKKRERK